MRTFTTTCPHCGDEHQIGLRPPKDGVCCTDGQVEHGPVKRQCRFCERRIGVNPLTGGLRPHKISQEQHECNHPGLPYLDGWCDGTDSEGAP